MFTRKTPYTLILVKFPDVATLFISRLLGADPPEVGIGTNAQVQYPNNSKFRVTDVYFVPAEEG